MDATTRVTASEFQNSFGMLSDKARRQPIVITKHGHDSLVVLPVEEWERLKRRDRHVGLTSEAPSEWIEAVRTAPSPPDYTAADVAPK
jgi:prevent-host-death family protein